MPDASDLCIHDPVLLGRAARIFRDVRKRAAARLLAEAAQAAVIPSGTFVTLAPPVTAPENTLNPTAPDRPQ